MRPSTNTQCHGWPLPSLPRCGPAHCVGPCTADADIPSTEYWPWSPVEVPPAAYALSLDWLALPPKEATSGIRSRPHSPGVSLYSCSQISSHNRCLSISKMRSLNQLSKASSDRMRFFSGSVSALAVLSLSKLRSSNANCDHVLPFQKARLARILKTSATAYSKAKPHRRCAG